MRAYLLDGQPAADVAARFGYTTAGLHSAVADFRAGSRDFFTDPPDPKTAPSKDAARARINERAQDYSIDEISQVLTREQIGLNRTGISEVIAEAGLPRIGDARTPCAVVPDARTYPGLARWTRTRSPTYPPTHPPGWPGCC